VPEGSLWAVKEKDNQYMTSALTIYPLVKF
jgi:hypothetical protein